jgi:hypothetical protein
LDNSSKKLELKYLVLRFIFAIATGLFISALNLDFVEGYLIDLRFQTKAFLGLADAPNSPISLVYINAKTVETYQGEPKYKDHLRFLNQLSSYNPKFIVYQFRIEDDDFVDIYGTESEKKDFAEQTKSIPNLLIATQNLTMKGATEPLTLKPPLNIFKLSSMPFSVDNKSFGKDGVTRRLMFKYQEQSMVQPIIAAYYNPEIQTVEKIRGNFYYLDSLQVYIDYHPNGSFASYSFEDVVNQKVPRDAFENKIVIVGTDLNKGPADYVATPYSRHFTAMTKVELQANQIQTLIDNSAPIRLPRPFNIAITIIISLLTLYATLSLTPSRGLLILGATFFGLAFVATFLFVSFDLWVDLAHPLLAIFLCYYFFIPYRLIKENRRSWEYYQKHKLLSEVEQLKTNFISMMSHDLKTPLARITGMTEVIYKDTQQLSSHQREALDTIRHSSDDLLKFINAILQYGSIESQGVQLHKQAKDINQLVSDVIKKHEFLAKVKKIKIVQELEPLFPVNVDPELIKQVFSNLLENAVKYSPEESTVWIRTREEGHNLIVEFQDQGMGIPQVDLPNIFMKFFRTHTVKTTTIKGSGLGLYLAQYFVELHKGHIKVDSSQDKGSKFTVELPLDK